MDYLPMKLYKKQFYCSKAQKEEIKLSPPCNTVFGKPEVEHKIGFERRREEWLVCCRNSCSIRYPKHSLARQFSSDNIIAGARDVRLLGEPFSAGVYFGIQASTGSIMGSTTCSTLRMFPHPKEHYTRKPQQAGGAEGVSNIVGVCNGRIIDSAILAYGSAILGPTDWKSANRMMLTGLCPH
jgi:hypothetical protein